MCVVELYKATALGVHSDYQIATLFRISHVLQIKMMVGDLQVVVSIVCIFGVVRYFVALLIATVKSCLLLVIVCEHSRRCWPTSFCRQAV